MTIKIAVGWLEHDSNYTTITSSSFANEKSEVLQWSMFGRDYDDDDDDYLDGRWREVK
jgi:hypothetical protein